jgi:uncharacterized protein (DUF58 family)
MYRRVQYSLPLTAEEPEDPVIAILRGRRRSKIEIDPTTEEYIVTIAASVTQHFIHKDRAVGMVSYGNTREVMQPDRGHRQLTKILETLAMTEATGTVPLTQVLLTEGDRLGRGITLVVITPAMDNTWVAASRELMRRGARVIAVVVDPTAFGGTGDPLTIMSELRASKIPTYLVRKDDDLAAALSQQLSYSPRRAS